MKRLYHRLSLAAGIVVLATTALSGRGGEGPGSGKPELNPREVFRSACDHLKALEARYGELKGVSRVKPRMETDDNKHLKHAALVFERNAVPPGKAPARPRDEGKPFVYVSVHVWSGPSQQPPAGAYGFTWKGQDHTAWVQVYGSNVKLVEAVRKEVAEPILAPIPQKP